MSNLELSVLDQDEAVACCSPMVREPLGEEAAADLAKMFKALSDPVRLRLLSLHDHNGYGYGYVPTPSGYGYVPVS